MVGYAVTVVIQPGRAPDDESQRPEWDAYRKYVSSVRTPKIVVVQDLDRPATYGSFWGEVNANIHRALGCVGTIVDGAIRDVDEMCNAGFKAIARRLCVGHAFSRPLRWDCEVEVFGRRVSPGQLIHADQHGFLVIPPEDEPMLLDAARFMDANECRTLIAAARSASGKTTETILRELAEAAAAFDRHTAERFGQQGEW
jgi:regulator of RNase E activity RraA